MISYPWLVEVEPGRFGVKVDDHVTDNDGDAPISIATHEVLSRMPPWYEPVCVDIGMDKGWWSQFCYAVNPHSRIVGFEPNPTSFSTLKDIFKGKSIELLPYAVSNSVKSIRFQMDGPTSHSRLADISGEGVEIQTIHPGFLFEKFGHIDIMKIDTEGHEPEILAALKPNLGKIQTLIFEFTTYWIGVAESISLLHMICEAYPYVYFVSRRGPPGLMGPIPKDHIATYVNDLNERSIQIDVVASHVLVNN